MKSKGVFVLILSLFIFGSTAAYAAAPESEIPVEECTETDNISTNDQESTLSEACVSEGNTIADNTDSSDCPEGDKYEEEHDEGAQSDSDSGEEPEEDAQSDSDSGEEPEEDAHSNADSGEEPEEDAQSDADPEEEPEDGDVANTGDKLESGPEDGQELEEQLPAEGSVQTLITEAAEAQEESSSDGSGSALSADSYTIGTISFDLVNNQTYTNSSEEVNCSVRFAFTDTRTGTNYECFITGLQIQGDGTTSALDRANAISNEIKTNPGGTSAKIVSAKAEKIVRNFLNGDEVSLKTNSTDADKLQLVDDLIDAEKYDRKYALEKGAEDPYGDILLCWAESASDVLAYTGWTVNRSGDGTKNEDATMTQFANAFFDNGSETNYGFIWYLNDVYAGQGQYDEDGNIVLAEHSYYKEENAKERKTYTGTVTTGDSRYFSLTQLQYDCSSNSDEETDAQADNLITTLDKGDGIGLGFYYYENGTILGGHAVTPFGYIRELQKSGAAALKAIFMADSDNDCDTVYAPVADANQTQQNRENRENAYTMYYVEPDASLFGINKLRIYSSKKDKDEDDKDNWQKLINKTYSIKSVKNVEDDETILPEPITAGTANCRTTPDIMPARLEVTNNEVVAGDIVSLEVMFFNCSYKAACGTDGSLTIKLSVDVYDQNDNFLYSVQNQATTDIFKAMQIKTFNIPLPMNTAGTYGLALILDGIGYYDTNGIWQPIQEAFTVNNILLGEITVKDGTNPENTITEIPTFCAYYALSSGDPLTVDFQMAPGLGKVRCLLDSKGNAVDEAYYSITDFGNGSYSISFSAEFLKILSAGEHMLTLQTENGKVYFIVNCII